MGKPMVLDCKFLNAHRTGEHNLACWRDATPEDGNLEALHTEIVTTVAAALSQSAKGGLSVAIDIGNATDRAAAAWLGVSDEPT